MNSHRSRKSKAGVVALGLALIGLLLLAGGQTSYATPQAPPASDTDASEGVPGGPVSEADAQLAMPTDQIIIKYRSLTLQEGAASPASAAEMQRLSEVAGVPLTYEREMSGDAYVLALPERQPLAEVQAIADRLSALPEVEYAEPDAIMVPMLTPNDPQYPNQWHYFAPGAGHYGINAPAAWNLTTGSASIVVAVIDTGITNHVDLSGRTVPGYDFIDDTWTANDGGGRDNDPSDPGDWVLADICYAGSPARNSSWHGTHVAGTIGAASNNGAGVAGVNWNSKILPVRVLGRCGGYTSDIADGSRWAAGLSVPGVPANANPAKVLNLSLGGYGACDATYQNAVNAIVAAGTTLVISAGNSNANAANYRPGNCNGVVTVAATDRDGGRASYSNYGAVVEISAPGGDQAYPNDPNGVLSTLNSGTQGPVADNYIYYQGTSMAAPHVAGVASLLYSRQPSLTPAQVLARLQNNVTPFPGGSSCTTAICGRGIVNAGAAVAAAANPVPTITGLSPSSATPGGPAITLTVNGTNFVSSSVVRWKGANRTTTYVSGTQLTAAITAADIATAGTASVTVFNPAPGGGASNAVSFVVGNPVPTIAGLNPSSALPGGPAFTLIVNGTNFVSSSVVRWKGANRTTTYVSGTQLTAAITAADIAAAGTASVTVFNPAPGGGASNAVSFVVGNPVPTITGLNPSSATPGGPAFTLTVNGTNFVSSSVVRWKGANRTTTYVSSTRLTGAITAADIAAAGTASVTVFNPVPGGGASNAVSFVVGSSRKSVYLPLIVKSPPTTGWTTIVSTDFEGTWPGPWDVGDNDGSTGGVYYWGKRNCRSYAGSYSGWGVGAGAQGSALGCGANYPNDADSWMVYGPFSLANTTAADLRFKLWTHSENSYDKVCRFASINGTDYWGTCASGNTNGWQDRVLDLSNVYTLGNLLGQPNVWIAIVFSSNASATFAEGGYVDNIVLRKCPSGATCPAGLLQALPSDSQLIESPEHVALPR